MVVRHDFGDVLENTTIKTVIESEGKIISALPSCGCTTAIADNKSLLIEVKTGSVPTHLGRTSKQFKKHIIIDVQYGTDKSKTQRERIQLLAKVYTKHAFDKLGQQQEERLNPKEV